MSDAKMDPQLVKKTQDALGKHIKKPPLTDKLLSKPPFRFLHDICTSVIKTTGFMKGLFTDSEMNSENVKDRDSKTAFLQKAIDLTGLVTGKTVAAKPSKIVAGHEADKTNEWLQLLAEAIGKKVNNDEYVKRVLTGDLTLPAEKSSSKPERKEREKSADRPNKPTSSKESHDTSSTTVNKSGNQAARRPSKGTTQPRPGGAKLDSTPPKAQTDPKKAPRSKRRDDDREKDKEKERDREKDRNREPERRHRDRSAKRERSGSAHDSKRDEDRKERHRDKDDKNRDNRQKDKDDRHRDRKDRDDRHKDTDDRHKDREDRHKDKDARHKDTEDRHNEREERHRKREEAENKENEGQPANTGDTAQVEGSRGSSNRANENEAPTMNGHMAPEEPAPQVTKRLARPSSARPAPPRVKQEPPPEEPVVLGPSNVSNIISDKQDDSDSEDNFEIKEDEETQPPPAAQPAAQAPQGEDAEHGGLVKKMMEAKEQLEGGSHAPQAPGQPAKRTEIERSSQVAEATRRKERELIRRDIDKLRAAIQALTRSVHPLGKILDFVQEDLDSMQGELTVWREENGRNQVALQREQSITEGCVEPLRAHLGELEAAMKDQLDLIAAVKSNVLKNDERIGKMLGSVAKS